METCVVLLILAITNSAAINIQVPLLVWAYAPPITGKGPRVDWPNHPASVDVTSRKLSNCFQGGCSSASRQQGERSGCPGALSTPHSTSICHFIHPCEVISHPSM